jgi:hypothetical protein
MQSLNIFRTREGSCFAFQNLEEFQIYLEKKLNRAGPTRQCPIGPLIWRHSDHGRRCLPTPTVFLLPLSPCACAQWRDPRSIFASCSSHLARLCRRAAPLLPATAKGSRFHPSRGKAAPQHPLAVPPFTSPRHWPQHQGKLCDPPPSSL